MLNGWIKIHRRILDWEWWDKPEMVVLFLYMIASANVEDSRWHGKVIKRGQFVTSLGTIERDNPKLSKKVIRTCLKRFKETGEIDILTTNSYSLITICKFDKYQFDCSLLREGEKENTPSETITDNKNVILEKPKKSKKHIEGEMKQRMQVFYNSLVPFVSLYGKDMIRAFYDYWSEPNKSHSKMRYEQEKTWDLNRRLARWANNNKEYRVNGNKNYQSSTTQRIEEATNLVESLLSS